MTVGVPETEVFAAADRVLARGERPTVDRVRAELGRGSPARVSQLLDAWWNALAQRMAGQAQLPDLPTEVSRAFAAVWQTACAEGERAAQAGLSEHRSTLDAQVSSARTAQQQAEEARDRALQEAASARDAHSLVSCRLTDLTALIETQRLQIIGLEREATTLRTEVSRQTAMFEDTRSALDAARRAADDERARLTGHIQAVENRANIEIDRAREEAKNVRRELIAAQRAHHISAKDLQSTSSALQAAQKRLAAAEARAEALTVRLTAPRTRKAPPHATPQGTPRAKAKRSPTRA